MPIFQPELETLPRPELERLQRERLRERFGVELEALPELPFRVKSELRDAYPFGLLQVPLEECVRIHASSGTHGKPTIVAYTRNDLDVWADCCARAVAAAGGAPGTVVHVAYGYGLFTGGLGLHYGAERLGCTVVPASGGNTPRQAQLLEDLGAEILCCTPSYALAIADHVSEPARLNLRAGLHGAEPWTAGLREAIERALLAIPELAPHYQLVVERPGRLDELTVEAELREGEPGGERLEALVEERLGRVLGLTARVRLGPPGSVARSEGKALRVLDR